MNRYFLFIIIFFFTVSCTKKDIYELKLSQNKLTMYVTEQVQLKASVAFTGVSQVDMIWSSDNPDVAEVDEVGNVTANSSGEAIITLTCLDKSVSCAINVLAEEFGLFMSKSHSSNRTMWIWKNGEFIFNSSSDFDIIPRDLTIYKTNIYACGSMYNNEDSVRRMYAAFWKDNIMNILPDNGFEAEARAIAVKNDTTYIVGNYFSTENPEVGGSALWINGDLSILSENHGDVVEDITFFQNFIVACGYSDNEAVYWINGSRQTLPGNSGMAKFVEAANNDLYFIGEITTPEGNRNTTIWRNGTDKATRYPLPDTDNSPTASFMYRDKLYIVGVIYNESDLYNTTYLYSYSDDSIQYFSFDDAIYYPAAVSVTASNMIIAFDKTEYTVEGGLTSSQSILMRNGAIETIAPDGVTNISPVSFIAR